MKKLIKFLIPLSIVLFSGLLHAAKEVDEKDFSGWLENYDTLKFDEERNAFLFLNEEKRGKYSKVFLESVVLYAKEGDAKTENALKASGYLEAGVKDILTRKGIAASEPGPGVLRARLAITGVEKSKEELKAYNFIPVSAVFRGAQAATGNVATYIDTMFEAEMVDSVSGERVAAVVAKGISETEKRSGDELTFKDVQPTLDQWLKQYEKTIDRFLANR